MAESMTVLGIMIDQRAWKAPHVQEIITRHGDRILCRMGIPTPSKENGLITLVVEGEQNHARLFCEELQTIEGVQVQMMSFINS